MQRNHEAWAMFLTVLGHQVLVVLSVRGITTWKSRGKGECRKLRREIMGEQATSFLAIKARWNFSAMERAKTKMESQPYNSCCHWERRGRATSQGWGLSVQPRHFAHSMAFEGSCIRRGGWGLLCHHWHPAVLSNCLLRPGPETILGDAMDGCSQTTEKEHFSLSITHLKITSIFFMLPN